MIEENEEEMKRKQMEEQEMAIIKCFYRAKENLEHLITLGIDEQNIKPIINKIEEELKKFRGY